MEYWLGEAAQRGHEFASAITKILRTSRERPRHCVTLDARDSLAAETTTLQVKIHVERERARRIGSLTMCQRLKLSSSSNSIVEADPTLQDWGEKGILHWAAENGNIDLLETRLKHGDDVNAINKIYRCTPLVAALRVGQVVLQCD